MEKCLSHFSSTDSINMKLFILAATLALAQACIDNPAAKCGTTDQVCPGGIDPMGCAMPDFCVPADSKYLHILKNVLFIFYNLHMYHLIY